MTLERLRGVLSGIGPPGDDQPITPREIAEILWLAVHTSGPGQDHGGSASGRSGRAGELPEATGEAVPTSAPPARRAGSSGPADAVPATGRHELHLPSTAEGEGTGGTGVLVPTAPMLAHPLAVQRALRPLKRRVPSRRVRLLDEEATAARIADQPRDVRPWVPVMTAAAERWLNLVLVVDTSPSMRLWRPLARELHETLARLGAFRDLRICYLAGAGPDIGVRSAPGAPPTGAATLIDPSGRQVILILSDCSGRHWWDGRADRALRLWGHAGPTAILQPLTERLWRRTALPPVAGTVLAARRCAPNTGLSFAPYDGDIGRRSGTIPVPVLECAPDWLADWAGMVAGNGGPRPAAMAFVPDRTRRGTEPVRQEHRLSIDERVQRFQTAASPEAARLAAHIAVSHPALPVMRLIQHQVLPGSRPGHLAEVLLSGLLRPRDAGRDLYEFVPGAREALLSTLPRSESWHTADVLTRISEEIERSTLAETFRAYLATEHDRGDHAIDPGDHAFALVSPEAIRLLDRTAVTAPTAASTTAEGPQAADDSPQAAHGDDRAPVDGEYESTEQATAQAPFRPRSELFDRLMDVVEARYATKSTVLETDPETAPGTASGSTTNGPTQIFVSYSPADERWATWIAWQLEAAGHRTVLQAWDFLPGTNFIDFMDRGVTQAHLVVAVLSQNYLRSRYGRLEWQAALRAAPGHATGKLVVVRVEDCPVDGLLATVAAVDLVGVTDPGQATERLLDHVGRALTDTPEPLGPPATPAANASVSRRVPTTSPAFPTGLTRHRAPVERLSVLHMSGPRFDRAATAATEPRSAELQNSVLHNVTRLVQAGVPSPDLIVVTGNLTESGSRGEFAEALSFLTGIRVLLGLEPQHVVIVPGPRDVTRAACHAYFSTCEAEDVAPRPPYWPKWRHFAGLFDEFYQGLDHLVFDPAQPWTLFPITDLKVVVAGINSTIAQTHREQDQYGWIGEEQAAWFDERLRRYESNGWLRLGAIAHSPLPDDPDAVQDAARLFMPRGRGHDDTLGERLNLITYGHEHENLITLGSGPLYVSGAAGQQQVLVLGDGGLERWAAAGDDEPRRVVRTWHGVTSTFAGPGDPPAGSLPPLDLAIARVRADVAEYRVLAGADPATHQPRLAGSLVELAIGHALTGLQMDSLRTATEAATIYRRLAERNPAFYEAPLACALWLIALGYGSLRDQAGRPAAAEAVTLLERLAATDPDAFARPLRLARLTLRSLA